MKKFLVLLLCLFFLFPSYALLAEEEPSLSVVGRGSVMVEPDTAKIQLGVEVLKKTAAEAQAANAWIMKNIISALKKQGVASDKIQTSGYSLFPEMKYEPNRAPEMVGYRCRNQVSVILEDLNQVGKMIDAGISSGANQVQGVQFFRRNDIPFKKLALEKAVKDAAEKAAAIASAAGIKIKKVKRIIEEGASAPSENIPVVRAMAGAAETPISFGLLEISAQVTVIYQVE
jgi:uncharacterized protein YggE